MKNNAFMFLLLILAGFTCQSQSFFLADDSGELGNGKDVIQSGPSDTLQLITWLHLTNTTPNTLRVMMKKEELSMVPGTNSSICWAGYCYGPEMTVSSFPLVMLPGEEASGCFAHYGPGGCRGVSIIRWIFFDESNPSDSLSITVHYSTYPSATESHNDTRFSLAAAGPVPAGRQITMKYALPTGVSGRIELRNNNGVIVSSYGGLSLSGNLSFAAEQLPAGIYFCTLLANGKAVKTRKIPVSH
jgi:hypothetical protein